jgi:hypothetical protein
LRRSARAVLAGVVLVVTAMALDIIGTSYGLLALLILSFALAVAGAIVAIRGIVEFVGERL